MTLPNANIGAGENPNRSDLYAGAQWMTRAGVNPTPAGNPCVSIFVYANSIPGAQAAILSSSSDLGTLLGLTNTGVLYFQCQTNAPPFFASIQSSVAITAGSWHHFFAKMNNATASLFLDGVSTGVGFAAAGTPGIGIDVALGRYDQGANQYFDGLLNNTAILDTNAYTWSDFATAGLKPKDLSLLVGLKAWIKPTVGNGVNWDEVTGAASWTNHGVVLDTNIP